ncbi:hypothetical protein ACTFIY_008757 [Dictyostelium cf. discoideum]
MKFLKYLLLLFLILKINGFVESAVDCQQNTEYFVENSCGKNPSKLHINNDIYYFESIGITPYSTPVYNETTSNYFWYLKDGIEYTFSYRYKGCQNFKSHSIISQGMYFQLLSQPLCQNTYFNYTVFNSGEMGENANYSNTPQNIISLNYNGSCSINFLIKPLSNSKGAFQSGAAKYTYPTCGFSNGTISVDSTKGYSNCHLFSQFDTNFLNEIQPSSPCFYSGLDSFYYYLFVDSKECATERLPIKLLDVFTPLEITFESVPDNNQNSIVSLSLSSGGDNGILNETISYAFLGSNGPDPLSTWSNKETRISTSTQYGYFYNKDFSTDPYKVLCSFNDAFLMKEYNPNFNFTVTKSDTCLENVTITFYPLPTQTFVVYDYILGNKLPLINNVLSVQYNKYLHIAEISSDSERYYSTAFYTPIYRIVETSNRIGCWKTYNITIDDYQIYTNLSMKVYDSDEYEYIFYPIDGVFVNVPANNFYIHYKVKDCEIESVIMISKYEEITPMDDVKMDISIYELGNCTHKSSILVKLDTVFGNFSKVFTSFSNSYFNFYLPNCTCNIGFFYSFPPLIDSESFTFNYIKDPYCNSTGYVIKLLGSNGNTIQEVYSNGIQLIPNDDVGIDFAYNIGPGENNVTIKYSNSQVTCYKSQIIDIQSPYEVPSVEVTPVIDCNSADGKISISNYMNFYSLDIIIGPSSVPITSGLVSNLRSGTYTIIYGNSGSCANSIDVYVPTSEQYVEITTSVISNPTCGEQSLNGDGKINVTLKHLGIKINTFYIQNQNQSLTFSDGGVYIAAAPGLNTLSISYGGCIWKRDVTTTISKPTFSFENIYNDTCLSSVYYKLINNNNNNNNIAINSVTSPYTLYSYQNEYYTRIETNLIYPYTITWNTYCTETFYREFSYDTPFNYYSNYIQYEIVKADNCNSFKIDIIIKNMNSFQKVTLSNKYPTPINSTHAIFKNLPPSNSYDISFSLFDGCSGTEMVGYQQLSNGNTKETIDIIKVNDICNSGKGSIQLSNMDTINHYYYVKTFSDYYVYTSYPIQPTSNNNTLLSNVPPGIYNITRNCKSITNCYLETKVVIENEDPKIESISVTDSYDKLNNGTVEIKLNYNPINPINFKIIGTQFSNQNGIFSNLPPKTYEVQVTLTDRMCPITISQSFTINLVTPPPSPTPSPQDPSDELSTSSFIQLNILLLLISILTILIL